MAEAHEEWADFFEWQLQRQTAELVAKPIERHLLAVWTGSMAYCHRRLAAFARGEDPGECVPQHVRRPDLDAESRRLAARIVAPQREEVSVHHSASPPSGWRQTGLRQAGGSVAARRTAGSLISMPRPGVSVRSA
jgi:hypothetical protein